MRRRRLPSRLLVGLCGLGAMVVLCLLGPPLLPRLPGHDPARSALLPPGSLVTVVQVERGSLLVSPKVEITAESVTVWQGSASKQLARSQVVSIDRFRFWLGSDRFGRDVLLQLLSGGRLSLLITVLSALVALVVGCGVGMTAASSAGVVDAVLMRAVDAMLAIPVLFLMILVSTLLRPGPWLLVVVLGLTSWMGLARLVRGQVLSLRSRTFVLAARSSGSRWYTIWSLHYRPNLVGPVAQDTALRLGDLVIAEATLSYLGLGVPAEIPTWGSLVAEGHTVMLDGWWLATFPGVAIAVLVICLALLGDGLQELA